MSNRREYLKQTLNNFNEAVKTCSKEQQNLRQELGAVTESLLDVQEELMDTFFDSYESSYALTLAYPREMFEQMADQAGIPHKGRELNDIARDLHQKGVI
jgi:hypothetical protein